MQNEADWMTRDGFMDYCVESNQMTQKTVADCEEEWEAMSGSYPPQGQGEPAAVPLGGLQGASGGGRMGNLARMGLTGFGGGWGKLQYISRFEPLFSGLTNKDVAHDKTHGANIQVRGLSGPARHLNSKTSTRRTQNEECDVAAF